MPIKQCDMREKPFYPFPENITLLLACSATHHREAKGTVRLPWGSIFYSPAYNCDLSASANFVLGN